ncbi:MAG: glycosyltransferase [Labilithrix sp.]|nr:glycosyltransferase [Labilithrix sp.]
MMRGENIVCFAKDWSEDPTSNNHVMRILARDNRVVWLNSIATRQPSFTDKGDVSKIVRKLKSFARGPKRVDARLDVYTPIVLPFPHSRLAGKVNHQILRASVGALRRSRGMSDFQLWTFLPTAAPYVGRLGESLSVYYVTDEFSHFTAVGRQIVDMEKDLLQRADVVFTTSKPLLERKRVHNPETHLALHGVDQAHFARALDPATPVAKEIAELPRPILGFIGLIEDWVDLDTIAHLAERRADWSIVLIGKSKVDLSRLDKYANVHVLGRKPYASLPEYCKGFDVALIPFEINELTRNVNPIKLREYFSAGLPCVSSPMPAVVEYAEIDRGPLANACYVARTKEAFHEAVVRALRDDSPEARARRSEAMKLETWEKKVEQLGDVVLRVKERKLSRSRGATG